MFQRKHHIILFLWSIFLILLVPGGFRNSICESEPELYEKKISVQSMKAGDWDPLSEMPQWALITVSAILYLNQFQRSHL